MALPKTIGDYEIEALLGRGGWSEVFRATRDGETFALKRILGTRPDGQPTDAERKRLAREIETLERFEDPRVVRLRDHGQTDDGTPYLVFDLIEGETLGALLERDPAARAQALAVLHDIALALQAAHALGVIHRDVKPTNILLRSATEGEPRGVLVDFGLARATDSSTLTRDGDVLGTPAYMAPEQADGRAAEAGPASDVYGLGAILYHVLTGAPPFAGEGLVQVLRAIVDDAPQPPREIRPDVDPALEALALDALSKDPAKRPPSAAAFAARLSEALAGSRTTIPSDDYLQRNTATLALIAAGALVFLTVLAFHFTQAPPRRAVRAALTTEADSDAIGHHVDPIDAAAVAGAAAADAANEAQPDPSVSPEPEAEIPAGPAPPETSGPVAPKPKTAKRVHCHECGRRQQASGENFCPLCAIAYVCGSCGEARTSKTGATCAACKARFE